MDPLEVEAVQQAMPHGIVEHGAQTADQTQQATDRRQETCEPREESCGRRGKQSRRFG